VLGDDLPGKADGPFKEEVDSIFPRAGKKRHAVHKSKV